MDTIYGYVRFLIRKNQSGSISSTEFFYAWNSQQTQYFKDLKGRFQARNTGKEGGNTGLIENETIETILSPFTKKAAIVIAAGIGPKPADFSYLLALRINGHEVKHINKNQIATVNDNAIDAPSEITNSYYYTPYGGNYSFLPNTVTAAEMDYLAMPVDVVWAYSIDGAGRQIYNSVGSTQPQWSQDDIIEITNRTLKAFGVSYKDGDLAQYGSSVINTGN